MRATRPPLQLLAAGLTLLALCGCQATLPRSVQPDDPPPGNAELMRYISQLEYLTADAGFRAVHVLAAGTPFDGSYDELKAALAARDLRPPDVEQRRLLTRAEVGGLIARACNLRTGVNWMLTGLNRYAWLELYHRGIAREPAELNYISGGEFLGVLTQAERYMTEQARIELGSAPG